MLLMPLGGMVMASVLIELGKIKEAITYLEDAVEHGAVNETLTRNLSIACNQHGQALGQAGDLESAIKFLRKAIKHRPEFAQAHNNLGLALAGTGRSEEALASIREALRLKPDYAIARHNAEVIQRKLKGR